MLNVMDHFYVIGKLGNLQDPGCETLCLVRELE